MVLLRLGVATLASFGVDVVCVLWNPPVLIHVKMRDFALAFTVRACFVYRFTETGRNGNGR